MFNCSPRHNAGIAVFLIVSAANLGIVARLFVPGTVGQLFFILTRVLMLATPLIWFFRVDKGKLVVSLPSKQQYLIGMILGTLMFGIILSAYWLVGQEWINPTDVQSKAEQIGLARPIIYLFSAFYFTVINSLFEEYIWRWFVCRQCEVMFPKNKAFYFAALCFTLHHVIALIAYTGNWLVTVVGAFGVFTAGVVWAWCYLTYGSLWSCYISHLLADLAIALIGWHLLFVSKSSFA
ncbi:CPBP family intramembrane metalloprotease [Leptolyngbya sp. GB1-A1]|uniref:CPBP family intramembrane glutamic endopeptidase n=1 Tax=Leptolyngbya sp. GB1-A1 TaxID=2933908 RepID=UPI00329A2EB6